MHALSHAHTRKQTKPKIVCPKHWVDKNLHKTVSYIDAQHRNGKSIPTTFGTLCDTLGLHRPI